MFQMDGLAKHRRKTDADWRKCVWRGQRAASLGTEVTGDTTEFVAEGPAEVGATAEAETFGNLGQGT